VPAPCGHQTPGKMPSGPKGNNYISPTPHSK
jgi:hypothetical protein